MGEIKTVDNIMYHRSSPLGEPESWDRLAYDKIGAPLAGIIVGENPQASLDGDRITLQVGGAVVSFPASVGLPLLNALTQHVPDAKAAEVDKLLAEQDVRLVTEKQQQLDQHEKALEAEHAQLDAAIDAKQAELDAIQTKIDEAKPVDAVIAEA